MVFKMISYLLQYPNQQWLQMDDLVNEVNELDDSEERTSLLAFLSSIGELPLDELEAHYVNVFDFNAACSLYLSYLKAGEQRERGAILVELKTLYNEHGFQMTDEELSDYLPVVLEFAAVAPLQIAINLLGSFDEPIHQVYEELDKVDSPYKLLLAACLKSIEKFKLVKGE